MIWGLSLTAWLVAVSLVVHLVVLGALWWFDALGSRTIVFNKAEEEQRTLEVERRELERKRQEEAERARRQLPEQHAEKLKDEADRRAVRELVEKIEAIREQHERVLEVRKRKLEQVALRPTEAYRKSQAQKVLREAQRIEKRAKELLDRPDMEPLAPAKYQVSRARQAVQDVIEMIDRQLAAPPITPEQTEAAAQEVASKAEAAIRFAKDAAEKALSVSESVSPEHQMATEQLAEDAAALAEQAQVLLEVDAQAAAAFNDTSAAGEPPALPEAATQALHQKAPGELYDLAKRLEQATHEAFTDARAAELALKQNTTFAEAAEKLVSTPPDRPALAAELAEASDVQTVADLGAYRQTLGRVVGEAESMRLAASNQASQVAALDPGATPADRQAAASRYAQMIALQRAATSTDGGIVDLSRAMALAWGGGGSGNSAVYFHEDIREGSGRQHAHHRNRGIRINQKQVSAQALPGRKFSRNSPRQGWLYIDTWYIIGPWENHGDLDFPGTHPPEYEIDFDATYEGTVINGEPRKLRWQFTQADMIRVTPPDEQRMSTYYAYTELYFEEDTEMLLALATDDAGKMWINDTLVWQDRGLSAYQIGENFRKVFFQRGYNKVLVRIENDPAYCQFSVLICPPEAAENL